MRINEKFAIIDEISWVHLDKNGKVIKRYNSNNWKNRMLIRLHLKKHRCIVAVGMANVAGLLLTDIGGSSYDYMQIGDGVTGALVGDHQLEAAESARLASTGTRETITQTNDTAQWVCTFNKVTDPTLTGTDLISEIGIFFHVTNDNTMLLRQTFTPESMQWDSGTPMGDSIIFTVRVQIKQGA